MDLQSRLEALIGPSLDAMGYDLVRVQLQGNQRLTLQIMADRKDGAAMGVEDCVGISRSLSALLDVEDPISGAYTLEVSSPGVDRPLTRAKDFVQWAGFEVKLESAQPIEGRKRFRGRLVGLDDADAVRLVVETGEVAIPLADVRGAKLVLTDELIRATIKDQEGLRTDD
ncbi:ribosome maturation factor RimP [Magnetospirillum molischianum]|uniref:Ribosome maturation factor RimP n=1 Tax=Magnetospirillum molischianum DSM 120 TaxID=1150626 RepID=H8FU75_MAGML|nr:ribosome maturation factor RimP [Magnetospirillum molischianum]CCG41913.1 Ribosome maturation factor rimP [Magnetospirillum molischianum DSM 120]